MWEVHSEVNLRVNSGQFSVKQVLNWSILSKTGPKLSKLSQNEVKTQSNGRVNLIYSEIHAWDPETDMYSIPLGSPTGPQKRSYVHVPVVPRTARSVH